MSQILKSSVAKKNKTENGEKAGLYIPKGTVLDVIKVHSKSLNLGETLENFF